MEVIVDCNHCGGYKDEADDDCYLCTAYKHSDFLKDKNKKLEQQLAKANELIDYCREVIDHEFGECKGHRDRIDAYLKDYK